ncbi:MAG: hypothetical protein C0494_15950 [Sphingobium sp.]|nr:hypothetical protein [Sphingobium sp.]
MCLDAVDRFGPVCVAAINAVTGMPVTYIQRHLCEMEGRGRVASYLGYDLRSCRDDVTLWVIAEPNARVGWSAASLTLFCGEEPPSVMQAEDAFFFEEADL